MTLGVVCAAHSPMINHEGADPAVEKTVRDGFARLGAWAEDFAPDVLVQFWPDHFNGFFYDMMPSFCVGTAAHSVGDWGTTSGALPVAQECAKDLAVALRAEDIDVAVSHRMAVDHGCTQIWDLMLGTATRFPLVPVFINCAAPPRPSFRRVRALGQAVGRFALASGQRVLLSGSGGLSHDPPIPSFDAAPPGRREALLDGRNQTPESRKIREGRVLASAFRLGTGEGECLPPDADWDRAFLDLMRRGEITALDDWDDDEVTRIAGKGGHEVRTWLAAFAALAEAGAYDPVVECYETVPAWLTGMGLMRAASK
jgi:2,3-dihydroxyphenylpropionate 1,2-dioxygenase